MKILQRPRNPFIFADKKQRNYIHVKFGRYEQAIYQELTSKIP